MNRPSRPTRRPSHPALLLLLGLLFCVSLISLSQQFFADDGHPRSSERRAVLPTPSQPTIAAPTPSSPASADALAYLQARDELSRRDATSTKSTAYLLNQVYLLFTPSTLQPGQTLESFTSGRAALSAAGSIASPSGRFQIRTLFVDTSSERGDMPLGFFVTDRGYFTGTTYFLPLDGGLTTMTHLGWKDARTISFDTTTHTNGVATVVPHTIRIATE